MKTTTLIITFGAGAALVMWQLFAVRPGTQRLAVLAVAVWCLLPAAPVLQVAYTEALAQWGSPSMIDRVDAATGWVRRNLGASPHPIEVLVGIPALAWGVSMRARRRQGWWVCAFGVTATASVTSRLLTSDLGAADTALSVAYGLVLGLFGRIPKQGEEIRFDGLVFRAERVLGRRIAKILVTRVEEEEGAEERELV